MKSIMLFFTLLVLVAGAGLCNAELQSADRLHKISYDFGHRLIPETVFQNTVRIRESIAGSDTNFPAEFSATISNLWMGAWAMIGVKEAPIPLNLNSELIDLPDGSGAKGFLITFPEPPRTPDNHFAFVFVEKDMRLRYLTYEKKFQFADVELPQAVLCGWNPDGSRYNLMLFGGVTRAEFLKVLAEYLGAAPKPAVQWNPQDLLL